MVTPLKLLALSPLAVSRNVTVLALTTPCGAPFTFVKSNAKVPNWLTFWVVFKWSKLSPVCPSAVSWLTAPSERPEAPLKAKSPPFNFTEYPEFMAIVTFTCPATPVSAIVTVPIEPEMPKLFAFRLKVSESAEAAGTMANPANTTSERIEVFSPAKRTVSPLGGEFSYNINNSARQGPVYLLNRPHVRH